MILLTQLELWTVTFQTPDFSRSSSASTVTSIAAAGKAPSADPAVKVRIILQGELPSPFDPPKGCAFNPRCPSVMARGSVDRPEMTGVAGQSAACWQP